MTSLTYSGHETFHCRHFWLKKGIDYLQDGHEFTNSDAVIHLGVGKNMVTSIRYWLQAFGLMGDNEPTEIAEYLFGETGVDPFIENPNTVWLLHYYLVSTNFASIYDLVFNQIGRDKVAFSLEYLILQIEAQLSLGSKTYAEKTLKNDVNTFLKNYVKPKKVKDLEDDLSGLLIEIELVKEVETAKGNSERTFKIENLERPELPAELVLYAILKHPKYGSAITFQELLNGIGSPGRVFALNSSGLISKLEKITSDHPSLVYSSDGGIQQLMLNDLSLKENPLTVLKPIYV